MMQQEEKALAVQRLQRMEAYRQEQLLKKMEEDERKIMELAEVCILLKFIGFHLQRNCNKYDASYSMHRIYKLHCKQPAINKPDELPFRYVHMQHQVLSLHRACLRLCVSVYTHFAQRKESIKKQQLQLKKEQDAHKRLLTEALDKMKRTQKWEPPEGVDLGIDIDRLERRVQEEMHDSPEKQMKREQEAREIEETKRREAKEQKQQEEARRLRKEKEAKEQREQKREENRRKKEQEAQEREEKRKIKAQEEEQEKKREEERLKTMREREAKKERERMSKAAQRERLQQVKNIDAESGRPVLYAY